MLHCNETHLLRSRTPHCPFPIQHRTFITRSPEIFSPVVVEGFVKPFTDEIRREISTKSISEKARGGDCFFSATEVLAKHDEKYMPGEVAAAIEKNKKKLETGSGNDGEAGDV